MLFNLTYRLLGVIYPAFRMLFPNQVIPVDALARAMVDVAMQETLETCQVVARQHTPNASSRKNKIRKRPEVAWVDIGHRPVAHVVLHPVEQMIAAQVPEFRFGVCARRW